MYSLYACMLNNRVTSQNALHRSRLAAFIADTLIRLESLVGDMHADSQSHDLYYMPMVHLRIAYFQNDEHCENLTRFMKHELLNLIPRLGLQEQVHVPLSPGYCYVFHREELFMHALIKLAHGLTHTGMSDFVVGSNSARWGAGYNYVMKYLDETFINLININSLNLRVHHFPSFAESIRKKYCSQNLRRDQGSFNVRGLMDVSVYEMTRFGSGPADEGSNQPRRPNTHIKQRSICANHKKYHGLSALTISFPNGMSTVIEIVSTRN